MNSWKNILLGALGLGLIVSGYNAYQRASGSEVTNRAVSTPGNSYKPEAVSTGATRSVKEESITLSEGNLVMFRSVVDPLSVAQAQRELLEKNDKLGRGKPLYIYLDTPGGDIQAGSQLIDTARSLGRPVHTITNFAASMGFNFVQRLDTRYVLPSGTLMAHRARVQGIGGQIPGELLTAVGFAYSQITKMEKQNAARLGISFEAYTALVKDEYWVSGEEAVVQGAADAVATIHCDSSLKGTEDKVFDTMLGPATVTFSRCPAISAPLAVHFGDEKVNRAEGRRYLSNYDALRRMLTGSDAR